jgi:TetR/AcrR family transcriptional regulator, ethionamide resistance regulator
MGALTNPEAQFGGARQRAREPTHEPVREPVRVDPAILDARRARRRARVIARLLPVVERLLEEQDSYLELTVDQILERDGMARSTFYSYFADKAELIIELGESAMQEIIASSQRIWQLPADATREQVGAAVADTIETYLPHTRVMNAMIEVSTYDAGVRARFNAAYAEAQHAAAQHIRDGQKAGFIRRDLHPDEAAGWITWMAERGMTQLVQHAGRAKLRRLEDTFTSILWYALYDGQGRT